MSIGGGIFLIVLGAILAFALNIQVGWANLSLIGYILIVAGVVVLIIGLVYLFRRRRTTVTTRAGVDDRTGTGYEETDRRDDVV